MTWNVSDHEEGFRDAMDVIARRTASSRDACLAAVEGWRRDGRNDLAEQSAVGADELDKIVQAALHLRDHPHSRRKWLVDPDGGMTLQRYVDEILRRPVVAIFPLKADGTRDIPIPQEDWPTYTIGDLSSDDDRITIETTRGPVVVCYLQERG